MADEPTTDVVRRLLADDGWGDVDPAAFHHAAVEGIAWALLDQTCDLADRGASEDAYREARATAERLLAADVAAARADERERIGAVLVELRESTSSGHPDCDHSEDCVACAADDIAAALAEQATP